MLHFTILPSLHGMCGGQGGQNFVTRNSGGQEFGELGNMSLVINGVPLLIIKYDELRKWDTLIK